ncbi:hypothetical protein AURDEDRAFT_157107 [Auricularia subglabra TFB-10046 SS5]|nr:hypothetical protein AURDEDRAFT_157107 [Auricularia subglabra TFB-10046 SS5]
MAAPSVRSGARTPDSSTEAVYQSKLLRALRSGDPSVIHPFLIDLSERSQATGDGAIDLAASTLHLAIRCASYDTVKLLLANRAINPNGVHPPGSGTTPLHLAAALARDDIVALLLEQPGIDDTLRDTQGKTCREVARGKDTIAVIQHSRAVLDARYLSLLHTYVLLPPTAPPPAELITILESPRARILNLSQQEQTNGLTLLHEAARRKDLRLVELAIRAGADVFCRDRKGRSINDVAGKDDRVKVFLRQYTNRNAALLESQPVGEPGVLKGYLNKYANVAKGYSPRWFVLKDGVLSYYRNQSDEGIASRGSISMKSASVKVSSAADKLRFEVHSHLSGQPGPSSTSGANSGGVQKWFLKANHYVELTRWTNALNASIEWSHRDASPVRPGPGMNDSTDAFSARGGSVDGASLRTHGTMAKRRSAPYSHIQQESSRRSLGSLADDDDAGPGDAYKTQDEDEDSFESSSRSGQSGTVPPHQDVIQVHANATATQLDATAGLISALLTNANRSSRKQEELHKELTECFATAQEMFGTYTQMVSERELWWKEKLDKERERAGVWEESLQIAAKEGEELEQELRKRGRGRGRRQSHSMSAWNGAEAGAMSTIRLSKKVPGAAAAASPSYDGLPDNKAPPAASLLLSSAPPAPPVDTLEVPQNDGALRSPGGSKIIVPPASLFVSTPTANEEVDTDEEDEFFDAIESNTLPLIVPSTMSQSPLKMADLPPSIDLSMYASYTHLRESLPISMDNRPAVSLWAVLKNSIGKDLTKISFPVYFNEPTSMLQRMAEDMEFSECLDSAAVEPDQFKRIAFVAAFAMSNYSSTIGRIAKPFNPMLGETFEYCRLDRRYRYVSEQVSHHPPMSACWAESPIWKYYGEVDAQNKFMGKSFEIRPTGVAHAELRLKDVRYEGKEDSPGKVTEHYTWKKVTTCVSGFILGSPTIDHYGEMTVTNHHTGDKCVLTFKPRGWRGRDAFEITGRVMDASSNVRLDIAGRWNSQLVARAAGTGDGDLLPDVSVDPPSSPSSPEYILLWRNTPKPKMPFNLTPFAITLNDCPDDLTTVLCPTDCRLRPDQRAFENGDYDRANELKSKQEELQRATRRKREAGQLPPHKPRWFEAKTDPDTGERVWQPLRVGDELEYWVERERIAKAGGIEKDKWKNVDEIFIQDA